MAWRRLPRGCLVGLLVALALAVAGVVLVRLALNPDNLRRLAESRLSAALGQPVSIGRMGVSLFPTPSVEGAEIRVGSGSAAAAPSVSLTSLRIVPRVSTLLSSRVVVDRVEVRGLSLRALRGKDGKWSLPLPSRSAPAQGAAGDGGGASDATSVDISRIAVEDASLLVVDEGQPPGASPAGLRHVSAVMVVQGGTARLESLSGAIGGSTIAGSGSASADGLHLSLAWQSLKPADLPAVFALLGAEPPAGLSVEGEKPLALDVTVDAGGTVSATGQLSASKLTFGTLTLTSLASPLRLASDRLSLDPLTFHAYGGQQRAALSADIGAVPVAWSLRSATTGVDINQLLSANTSARDKVSGTARLDTDLRGTAAAPVERSVAGTIAIEIASGAIRNFPLLGALNSALGIGTAADQRDLRFDTLSGTLRVANGAMTTDDLVARTGELTLNAAGTLRFDLALDFSGTARFTRAVSDDLVRRFKHLGGLRNADGDIEVPFAVTGTASAPSFSVDVDKVLRRAAGKELNRQLNRQLKGLIKIR